jgi:hypothetical protein
MAFGPFCLQTPQCPQHRFLTLPLSSLDFPPACCGSGLRLWLAGSPLTPAVSSSSSYRRVLHLQLLPTSPHGNAVSFGFRPENVCLKRTCTSLTIRAFRRTSRPFRDSFLILSTFTQDCVLGYFRAVPPGRHDDSNTILVQRGVTVSVTFLRSSRGSKRTTKNRYRR